MPSSIQQSRTKAIHWNDSLLQPGFTAARQISLYDIAGIIQGSINLTPLFFYAYSIRFATVIGSKNIQVLIPVSLSKKRNISFSISKK